MTTLKHIVPSNIRRLAGAVALAIGVSWGSSVGHAAQQHTTAIQPDATTPHRTRLISRTAATRSS